MCELLGLSSNQIANVALSLSKLAEHGAALDTHNDGWGAAYYEGLDARLLKDAAQLASSPWLRTMNDLDLESPIVIAHTRTATRGTRSYENTQPFMRELAGRMHVFAHNGDIPEILDATAFPLRRFTPIGDTDSERAFCVLLDRLAKSWDVHRKPTVENRFSLLSQFASELRRMGPANFLYSDGELVFAHGHRRRDASTREIKPPGLAMLTRSCLGRLETLAVHALAIQADRPTATAEQDVVLFASVPLSDEPWVPLAEGELIAAAKGHIVARQRPGQNPIFLENPAVTPATRAGDSLTAL